MFKRVILENWAAVVPMVAFGLLAAVFLLTTIRALMMKAVDREKMAQMPLSEASEHEQANPETSDEA